jgi:hypothetical protein
MPGAPIPLSQRAKTNNPDLLLRSSRRWLHGIGTYAFDTARHAWRQLGQWALPFHGKAEYVPELKLWVGFLLDYDNPLPSPRLGVCDLSAMDSSQHFETGFHPAL